jgi:hypothetical protein
MNLVRAIPPRVRARGLMLNRASQALSWGYDDFA